MTQEPWIRIGWFAAAFVTVALWEHLAPRRELTVAKSWRWANNLGVFLVGSVLVRLLFPAAAVGAALAASAAGWGLLNAVVLPAWIEALVAVIVLDFAIWAQHVLFHAAPVLWRLHRMHHADLDFDVTTGLRFHPLELLLSMLIKIGVVIALGASPLAVLVFEVLLNATSLFNHGNLRLSEGLDRVLRLVVVTPEMHRVHHSWHPAETNANFGFNLPWWDRLFGTYTAQPRDGHEAMTIGLHEFRDAGQLRLDRMLIQPFVGAPRSHPVRFGRRGD